MTDEEQLVKLREDLDEHKKYGGGIGSWVSGDQVEWLYSEFTQALAENAALKARVEELELNARAEFTLRQKLEAERDDLRALIRDIGKEAFDRDEPLPKAPRL